VLEHELQADAGGLVGWVLDVVESLGALGVAAPLLLETVVPPIPGEVVLPWPASSCSRTGSRCSPSW
jgi:membrane protein DedA with SNARE-associated domain